jgi:hypothetical protein
MDVRGDLLYTWENRDDYHSEGEQSDAELEQSDFPLTAEHIQSVIGLPPGDVRNQQTHRRARSIIVTEESVESTLKLPDGPSIDVLHMFREGMKVRNHIALAVGQEDDALTFPFQLATLAPDNLSIIFHNFVLPLRKTSRRSSSFVTQDLHGNQFNIVFS